jgi:hypothetical protein
MTGSGSLAAMALVLCGLTPATARAHGGGVNADGCHTNRQTGDYHCHRPQRAQAPAPNRASGGAYYGSCADARAAGAAPLRRGDPGYRAGLDRDDDGVACE